jgi:hypothetical protein
VATTKKKKGWIQTVNKGIAKRGTEGSFKTYCEKQGFPGCNDACIAKGLKSPNPAIRKKAGLAKAFAGLRKKGK